MRAPAFWSSPAPTWAARLLAPLSWVWAARTASRIRRAVPFDPGVPVICIGNVTSGGTGKTPVALALAARLIAQGRRPHILSRGYGGREHGPLPVDPARHSAADVGDEPLLLAQAAPTWVARDRAAGARAMVAAGADVIVMDDGFQNPSLRKSLSLLVLDGGAGLGNGCVIPAGPLREPWAVARIRAHGVIVVGAVTVSLPALEGLPVLHARLAPRNGPMVKGLAVIAFAGIGRPAKFFASLAQAGADIVERRCFPDHHAYSAADLDALSDAARRLNAVLVTTAKDAARLTPEWRAQVMVLEVALELADWRPLDQLLSLTQQPES